MKCIIILLLLAIKVNAQEGEWRRLLSAEQDIYVESLPTSSSSIDYTSLSIDPKLFSGKRHYVVQASNMLGDHLPAFQIGFQEGVFKIFKTAIPKSDSDGYGMNNFHAKNKRTNCDFSDLEGLAPDPVDWICPIGGNYATSGDSLELVCAGIRMHSTFFMGESLLTFKSKVFESRAGLNPVSSLVIQPFNSEEPAIDLSCSVFESRAGAFISGVIDFGDLNGIKSDEEGAPFFLLACELFSLTISGSKITQFAEAEV
jgi:hypothetical protein